MVYLSPTIKMIPLKRSASFLALLTGLAVLAGYLLSKASLVGKAGIHFFYKQYRFFNQWYKGAAVVFVGWLLLFLLHRLVQTKLPPAKRAWAHVLGMALALAGLYFTFTGFRNDLSYRLLGERFHLGAYLFWIGWVLIALFHLWPARPKAATADRSALPGA